MTDGKKFNIAVITSVALTGVIISYNVFQEHFATGIADYAKRRAYYEKTISKKGLSFHKGMFWKEKE